VLLAGAVTSAALVVRALVRRERPPRLAAAGVAATAAYARVVRPWLRTWGTRPGDADKPLAGDETVPDPGVQQTRAITIDAPPEVVWSWPAQLGQDRAGFYSYRWLENLAGCRMPFGAARSDRASACTAGRSVGVGLVPRSTEGDD